MMNLENQHELVKRIYQAWREQFHIGDSSLNLDLAIVAAEVASVYHEELSDWLNDLASGSIVLEMPQRPTKRFTAVLKTAPLSTSTQVFKG